MSERLPESRGISGRLSRLLLDQEVAGSFPVAPTGFRHRYKQSHDSRRPHSHEMRAPLFLVDPHSPFVSPPLTNGAARGVR